jgi:hypothetical protein
VGSLDAYPKVGFKGDFMAVSRWQVNRFERMLFRAALILAGLILAVRIGAIILMLSLHHIR